MKKITDFSIVFIAYPIYYISSQPDLSHTAKKINKKKTIITKKSKKKLENLLKNIYVLYPLSHPL